MSFHSPANKTHFHIKGFEVDLPLKQRLKATRKWPIQPDPWPSSLKTLSFLLHRGLVRLFGRLGRGGKSARRLGFSPFLHWRSLCGGERETGYEIWLFPPSLWFSALTKRSRPVEQPSISGREIIHTLPCSEVTGSPFPYVLRVPGVSNKFLLLFRLKTLPRARNGRGESEIFLSFFFLITSLYSSWNASAILG